MKKDFLLIIFALLSLSLSAADDNDGYKVLERVYLSTDKDVYVSGDDIWCSVFCFYVTGADYVLSPFSSTVYVELTSDDGVAQTAKIALVNGRGAGVFKLRTDLPTGNYELLAYTSQNRNEEGFAPMRRLVTIYNTLSSERVKGNVVLDNEVAAMPLSGDRKITPEKEIGISHSSNVLSSEPFQVVIDNPFGETVSLSVSIFNEDSLSTLEKFTIGDYISSSHFKENGDVGSFYVPDYEGEVIHFHIEDLPDNLRKGSGVNVMCSVSGKSNHIYTSSVDSSGKSSIYANNIFGENEMFCQVLSSDTLVSCKISIDDPFVRYQPSGDIPKLYINSSIADKLAKRGVGMQLGRRFGVDTLLERIKVRNDNFLGSSIVYHLDNYTRFPLMSEVLIEFIPELSKRTRNGKDVIRVMLNDRYKELYFSNGMSLFLLDGVPVFNHSKLISYDPLLVEDITIYPNRYGIGNILFEGVVRFDTYKKDLPSFDLDSKVSVFKYQGALIPARTAVVNEDEHPDYRQTIYWNPIVDVLSGKSFRIDCKAPMYKGDFVIIVEGVTESGRPVYGKSSFRVR